VLYKPSVFPLKRRKKAFSPSLWDRIFARGGKTQKEEEIQHQNTKRKAKVI